MCLSEHGDEDDEQHLLRALNERLQRNNDLVVQLQNQLQQVQRTAASMRLQQQRSRMRSASRVDGAGSSDHNNNSLLLDRSLLLASERSEGRLF